MRVRTDPHRERQLRVLLTDDELEKVRVVAASKNKTVSDVARELFAQAYREVQPPR